MIKNTKEIWKNASLGSKLIKRSMYLIKSSSVPVLMMIGELVLGMPVWKDRYRNTHPKPHAIKLLANLKIAINLRPFMFNYLDPKLSN